MTAIQWVQYNELATGRNHPDGDEDTINRCLRQFLTNSGIDPDDVNPAITSGSVTASGSTTSRSLAARFAEWTNVLDYGAVGDGVTNDTAAFDAAVAAAPSGGVLYLPPGYTFLLDPVSITKPLTVWGYGSSIKSNTAVSGQGTIFFSGELSATTTALTASVTDGALVLAVGDVGGFSVGDWIEVKDTSATTTDYAYEWHQIKLISGSSLYLHTPICGKWTYPGSASGTVTKMTMIEAPRVVGVKFDGNGLGASSAWGPLAFKYCTSPQAKDVIVTNYRLYGIDFESCVGGVATGCYVYASSADLSVAAAPDGGYAIHFGSGSLYTSAENNFIRGSRHAVIGTTGAKYWKAVSNLCTGQYAAAVTTHFRRAVDVAIIGNTIVGVTPKSFTDTTTPTGLQGIVISDTDSRATIVGNTISHITGSGIYYSQSALQDGDSVIADNVLYNCYDPSAGSYGTIYVDHCYRVSVHGNKVYRLDTTNFSAIRINLSQVISVLNNHVYYSVQQTGTQIAIRLADAKKVRVALNQVTIDGSTSNASAFRVTSSSAGASDGIKFHDNDAVLSNSALSLVVDSNATDVRAYQNSWNDPIGSDRGDASVTLKAIDDAEVQLFATTLTANRTVTLSSTGAFEGAKFRIVRTGLGSFTLDVGGLKTIASATAAFVDVMYTGSAWVLTGYGAL